MRLTVGVRGGELAALGGVLLALRDIKLRAVCFADRSIARKPKTFVQVVFLDVTVAEKILAIQIEFAVLDRNPRLAAPSLRFILVVSKAVFIAALDGIRGAFVTREAFEFVPAPISA